jgi:hypothetical protein
MTGRRSDMNPHFESLLSSAFARRPRETLSCYLHKPHLEDLERSGLGMETIDRQRLRDVPPGMISPLLGFDVPQVTSALLFPFTDPAGGFMNHIRMKVFPSITTKQGNTIKYLQPAKTGSRLYFVVSVLDQACHSDAPTYFAEGEKKAACIAQHLDLPVVGFCGIENWHAGGSSELLDDFRHIRLKGRVVRLVPDGDVQTNPNVRRGAMRFAQALSRRGARVELVTLPVEEAA